LKRPALQRPEVGKHEAIPPIGYFKTHPGIQLYSRELGKKLAKHYREGKYFSFGSFSSTQDIQDLSSLIEKVDSHKRKSKRKKKKMRGRNKIPINRSYRCNKRWYKNWIGEIGFSRNDDCHAKWGSCFYRRDL